MFYKFIRENYGHRHLRDVKDFNNLKNRILINNEKKLFLIQCRRERICPNNIKFAVKNLYCLHFYNNTTRKSIDNIVNKLEFKLLNEEINDVHKHLKYLNKQLTSLDIKIKNSLPIDIYNTIKNYKNRKTNPIKKTQNKLKDKLNKLKSSNVNTIENINLNVHRIKNLEDNWIVNNSNVEIPTNVSDILRLGDKFSSSFVTNKSSIIFDIVKDIESNMHKIPFEVVDEFRHKVINISEKFIKNKNINNISQIDREIASKIKETKTFLSNNKKEMLRWF